MKNVLILGASYGSLLGTKMLLAGHSVTLVCTKPTADLINEEGTIVNFPIRDRETIVEVRSKELAGDLLASVPEAVKPELFDLVVLGMQEPQYRSEGVRELMYRVASSRRPCLAIMNIPPPPYLKRIPSLITEPLMPCYADSVVWEKFEPGLVTLASPDPQAFRPVNKPKNVLQVGLATNFKTASFEAEEHTKILHDLEVDIEGARLALGDGGIEIPVKLRMHESVFVPLSKWPMLLVGNYRCINTDRMISINEAVHGNIDASRELYDWVCGLCLKLGASEKDMVPFEKYAKAALGLLKPSSAARALSGGAQQIERVDCLVRKIALQLGLYSKIVDDIVACVDGHLEKNRMVV